MLASSRGPYAARTPAGGINPAPTNKFVLWTNRDGPAHPGGRRAGCPHPAALYAAANPRGRDKSRPYGQILRFEPTETAPPTRAAVGRDALIPPHPAPPQPPRADMESAHTTNGGRAANRETAVLAL